MPSRIVPSPFLSLLLLVPALSASAAPLSLPSRLTAALAAHGSHELVAREADDRVMRAKEAASSPKFGTASQWGVAAPSPVARHGGASAVVNEKIYVFGGYTTAFIPQRDSHVYDPATNVWTALPPLPDAITHAQAAVVGTRIYLAGGELGDGSSSNRQLLDRVHMFDTVSRQWTPDALPPLPQLRSSGGFVALGNELHYIAGARPASPEDIDVGDHYVYDLANPGAGWQTRAPFPDPRNHFQAIAFGGRIYVIGGQKRHNLPFPLPDGDPGYAERKTNYAYNPATNAWTQIADLPIPAEWEGISELERSSFTWNGKIVIGGGVRDGSGPLDAQFAYDVASNTWYRWPTLPAKRRSPILQLVNQRVIYGTGGSGDDGLTPDTAMWTNKIRNDSPRVLFVRGANNTGGFGVANTDAERTEHLSSVDDPSTATSNYSWMQLRSLLESEGFVVEERAEPLALEALPTPLSEYAVVVMGSNNAAYAPPSVDAIEGFIRARGGVLFVGDMRFGPTAVAAAASDNHFLSRFGLTVQQGLGTYSLTRTPDFVVPGHPLVLGIDEIKGVPAAAGDTVSPVRLGAVPSGVTLEVFARAEGQVQQLDGNVRPADELDAAALAGSVQGGRFVVLYDRDVFVNEKLKTSASSIVAADNLDFAVNVFDWLAARRDGVLLNDGFEDPVP